MVCMVHSPVSVPDGVLKSVNIHQPTTRLTALLVADDLWGSVSIGCAAYYHSVLTALLVTLGGLGNGEVVAESRENGAHMHPAIRYSRHIALAVTGLADLGLAAEAAHEGRLGVAALAEGCLLSASARVRVGEETRQIEPQGARHALNNGGARTAVLRVGRARRYMV